MPELIISGRGIDEQYIEEMQDSFAQRRESDIKNSLELNPIEQDCIPVALNIFNAEMRQRNPEHIDVTLESIVVVPPLAGALKGGGGFDEATRLCKIERLDEGIPADYRAFKYVHIILHELVHSQNISILHARSRLGIEDRYYGTTSRIGYDFIEKRYKTGFNNQPVTKQQIRFRGFNEAVTDYDALEILLRNANFLNQEIGYLRMNPNMRHSDLLKESPYYREVVILESIINAICTKKGRRFNDVWTTIRDGASTGDMKHLRIIERIYGPGALRMLSVLRSSGTKGIYIIKEDALENPQNSGYKKILRRVARPHEFIDHNKMKSVDDYISFYFNEATEAQREQIEDLILVDEEKQKLQKRRDSIEKSRLRSTKF